MSHRASLFVSLVLVTGACDSDDSSGTCALPERCGGSVEGAWQSTCTPRIDDLTFRETTTGVEPVVRNCTMSLTEHDVVRSQTLTFTTDSYTLASRTSGTWTGRAGADCLADFEVACADLPGIGAFGMTACAEADGACRFSGVIANEGESSGALVIGASTVTLDGMTFAMCASGDSLGLTWDDDGVFTYRRL